MNRNYIGKNTIIRYWRIWVLSSLEGDNACFVFKGKTLQNAYKSAQKYCDENNAKIKYKTLSVGEVAYECDYWGRKI